MPLMSRICYVYPWRGFEHQSIHVCEVCADESQGTCEIQAVKFEVMQQVPIGTMQSQPPKDLQRRSRLWPLCGQGRKRSLGCLQLQALSAQILRTFQDLWLPGFFSLIPLLSFPGLLLALCGPGP